MSVNQSELFLSRTLAALSATDERAAELNLQFLESAIEVVCNLPSPVKEDTLVSLILLDAGMRPEEGTHVRVSGYPLEERPI